MFHSSSRAASPRGIEPVSVPARSLPSIPSAIWVALLSVFVIGCRGSFKLEPSDHETVLAQQVLGDDKQRPEYRDSVTLTTGSVDASDLVSLGGNAKSRRDYWGFSPDSFPVNGRVWYPADGDGPFPLVLVVHGNHDMTDYSDPGYDYLGEHLASRGYILASLDMNFLNGSIREENDARGWMFLKHIQEWQRFDELEDSPVRGRVDLTRISLMGHSRGGEAVAVAAALNRLSRYPEDGNVTFDFGFDIRSIVAIAPVDGQYRPADQGTPIRDVSYLVLHGSHDGDVSSFHGLRQYKRTTFSPESDGFKAAVYVYRANHGQWNTVWGPNDNGTRSSRILALDALMPPEDQRGMALVYVTAFLEATLKGEKRYLPLFADHRVAGGWLPPTMYVTRYQHASFRPLTDYEEDVDLTTGTQPGVRIDGDSLGTWKESGLYLRSRNRASTSSSQESQAVWLGWNRKVAGQDELGRPARYVLNLPEGLSAEWGLGAGDALDLLLAATDSKPGPRKTEEADSAGAQGVAGQEAEGSEDTRGGNPSTGGEGAGSRGEDPEGSDDEDEPIDLSVVLTDTTGLSAKVSLSGYGPIRRPLEMSILRRSDLEETRYPQQYEIVQQSYTIPLSDFLEAEGRLDLSALATVEFLFDRTDAGEVILDQVGFSAPDPAFLRARVPRD
jgi:dienelactone hydrolase